MELEKPWVSFCMSTYKRPSFLEKQLRCILKQEFKNFEIVISDNDPLKSGSIICNSFNDERIKYECNSENLGMVKSFNKAIDRACGEFVVMVTDDDPVLENFLAFFYEFEKKYPGYSLYAGFERKHKKKSEVEIINKNDFAVQILNPKLTKSLHWSGCLIKRSTLCSVGKLADYGSGHLMDHIMMVLCGSYDGAVVINQLFSYTVSHDNNYSKVNLDSYYNGCTNFYNILVNHDLLKSNFAENKKMILIHLKHWFISCFFVLRKYYTLNGENRASNVLKVEAEAQKILKLKFMRHCYFKYEIKKVIFFLKKNLGFLKGSKDF